MGIGTVVTLDHSVTVWTSLKSLLTLGLVETLPFIVPISIKLLFGVSTLRIVFIRVKLNTNLVGRFKILCELFSAFPIDKDSSLQEKSIIHLSLLQVKYETKALLLV